MHYVNKTGLELKILLLHLPTCWDYRHIPPHPSLHDFLRWLHLVSLQGRWPQTQPAVTFRFQNPVHWLLPLSSSGTSQELSVSYSNDLPLRWFFPHGTFTIHFLLTTWAHLSCLKVCIPRNSFPLVLSVYLTLSASYFCFGWGTPSIGSRIKYFIPSRWRYLGSSGTLRRYSIAGGSTSPRVGFEGFTPLPVLPLPLPFCLLCVDRDAISQFPLLPTSHAFPAPLGARVPWTLVLGTIS